MVVHLMFGTWKMVCESLWMGWWPSPNKNNSTMLWPSKTIPSNESQHKYNWRKGNVQKLEVLKSNPKFYPTAWTGWFSNVWVELILRCSYSIICILMYSCIWGKKSFSSMKNLAALEQFSTIIYVVPSQWGR